MSANTSYDYWLRWAQASILQRGSGLCGGTVIRAAAAIATERANRGETACVWGALESLHGRDYQPGGGAA